MRMLDQLSRKWRNYVLGQSINYSLVAHNRDFVRNRTSHFGDHGDNALLLDSARASGLLPVLEAYSSYIVVFANFHRHPLLN
jgi:hypothetical protein